MFGFLGCLIGHPSNGKQSRRLQRRNLEKAVQRTRLKIAVLDEEAALADACCPACMFGITYQRLMDKLSHQQEWLKILKSKA
jgi:hypothetical protein